MELELEQRRDHAAVSKLLQLRDQVKGLRRELDVVDTAVFPVVDVFDDGEYLIVVADLPGVASESLCVAMQDNIVQLSGFREAIRHGERLQHERQEGHFDKVIQLPCAVDYPAANAELKHGVLSLTLPKHTSS